MANLRHFQNGELEEDNVKVDQNGGKVIVKVENTVGKGAISPFPTMFSNNLYCRHVKTKAFLRKG